jgi:hypothetical protein
MAQTTNQLVTWCDEIEALCKKIRNHIKKQQAEQAQLTLIDEPVQEWEIFSKQVQHLFSKLPDVVEICIPLGMIEQMLGKGRVPAMRMLKDLGYKSMTNKRGLYPVWDEKENKVTFYQFHGRYYRFDRIYFSGAK